MLFRAFAMFYLVPCAFDIRLCFIKIRDLSLAPVRNLELAFYLSHMSIFFILTSYIFWGWCFNDLDLRLIHKFLVYV